MDFGLGLILSFTDNASAGIKSATSNFLRMTEMAEQATSAINNMSDITSLGALSMIADQVGNSFIEMGKTITGVFSSLFQNVLKVGSDFESFEITLNALYGEGNEAQAQKAIDKLMEFSMKTPFEVNDVKDMLVVLKSQGIDAFKTMGSELSNTHQETLAWLGDLMAFKPDVLASRWRLGFTNYLGSGEFKVLRNILDMGEIEDILGRDAGATPEARMQDLIDLASMKHLDGLMESMMGTWQQTLSNMSDLFTQFFLGISDSGVFDDLKSSLKNVSEALADSLQSENLEAISKTVGESLKFITKPLEKLSKLVAKFITGITKLAKTQPKLAKWAIQITAIAGALSLLTGIALKSLSTFANLAIIYIAMGNSFASMKATLIRGITSIGSMLAPLALAIAGVYFAWNTDFMGIRSMLIDFANNTIDAFFTARDAVNMSVLDMMGVFNNLKSEGGFWNNMTAGLMKLMIVCRALSELWNSEDGFTLSADTYNKALELGVLPLINGILDLKYRFGLFKEGFIAGFKEVSNSVKEFIKGLKVNVQGTFLETALDRLTSFFELLSSNDADAWYTFGESFGKFTTRALVFFVAFKALDSIIGKLTVFLKVFTLIGTAFKAIKGVGRMFKGIGTILSGAFTRAFPHISKITKGIKEISKLLKGGSLVPSTKISSGFLKIANGVSKVIPAITENIIPAVSTFGRTVLLPILEDIGASILGFLGSLSAPVVTAIIALFAPIITYAVTHWEEFKSKVLAIWDTFITEGESMLNTFKEGFISIWENIKTATQPVVDAFLNLKEKVGELLSVLAEKASNAWKGIKKKAERFSQAVKLTIEDMINSDTVQTIISVLTILGNFFVDILAPTIQGAISLVVSMFKSGWNIIVAIFNTIVTTVSAIMTRTMDVISGIINVIIGIFTGDLSRVIEGVSSIFKGIFKAVSTILGSVLKCIVSILSEVISFGKGAFDTLKGVVVSALGNILNDFGSVFHYIYKTAKQKIGDVINVVKNGLNKVKNFFSGLKLSLPKFKLPHFSVSGKLSLKPPSVPKINVDWYAKGGVFNQPSVIGVGEDGQEAVMPLEKNTGWISVLADKVGGLINSKSSLNVRGLSSFTSSITRGISRVFSLLPTGKESDEDTPTPKPINLDDGGGSSDNSYIPRTSNVAQGDIDNSVTFEKGSIIIQVSNASTEDAEKFAEIVMEKIKRKQKLERMTNYKDMNTEIPDLAY